MGSSCVEKRWPIVVKIFGNVIQRRENSFGSRIDIKTNVLRACRRNDAGLFADRTGPQEWMDNSIDASKEKNVKDLWDKRWKIFIH